MVKATAASSTTATTYYPTRFYNVTSTTPTKHIFANGELVAVVTGTGTSAVVHYVHTDHLGGSNVLTSSSGKPFDYFHQGAEKLGYYGPITKIFVGQLKDSGLVKTVIDNVKPQYIENLKNLPRP